MVGATGIEPATSWSQIIKSTVHLRPAIPANADYIVIRKTWIFLLKQKGYSFTTVKTAVRLTYFVTVLHTKGKRIIPKTYKKRYHIHYLTRGIGHAIIILRG